MSRENVEVVRRAFAAVNHRPKPNFATVNALYHPDHELVSATTGVEGRTHPGARGFREWLTDMSDVFEAWEVALETVQSIDEDGVLVAWTFSARSKHGVPIERRGASVLVVRDGRIVRTENYASFEKAVEAAGLSEQDAHAEP